MHFKNANVLAVGDTVQPGRLPTLDWFCGGWIGGLPDRAKGAAGSRRRSDRSIVPAVGPVMTKADLQASYATITKIREKLVALMKKGQGAQNMIDARRGRRVQGRDAGRRRDVSLRGMPGTVGSRPGTRGGRLAGMNMARAGPTMRWLPGDGVRAGRGGAHAQPPAPRTGPPRRTRIRRSLDRYCVTCHNQRLKTASVEFDRLDLAHPGKNAVVWERAIRKLRARDDAAAGRAAPTGGRRLVAGGLYSRRRSTTRARRNPNPGNVRIHRLNRAGIQTRCATCSRLDVDVSALLPNDDISEGSTTSRAR